MENQKLEVDELKAKMAEAAEYVERAMSGLKGTHIKPELLKKALDILRGKE